MINAARVPRRSALFSFFAVFQMLILAACGGGSSTGTAPAIAQTDAPPIVQTNPQNATVPSAPATWLYDQALTGSQNQGALPSTGTVQVGFMGTTSYRGSTYYFAEISGTISPQDVDVYFSWNGRFSEDAYADLLNPPLPCSAPRSELQLASPIDFTAVGTSSGKATTYQCQVSNGTTAWSLSVANAGPATVSVPIGTFMTTKTVATWTLGTVEKDLTTYMFGDVLIERDTVEKRNGLFFASYTIKLRSGPITIAEPGPSVLGSAFW